MSIQDKIIKQIDDCWGAADVLFKEARKTEDDHARAFVRGQAFAINSMARMLLWLLQEHPPAVGMVWCKCGNLESEGNARAAYMSWRCRKCGEHYILAGKMPWDNTR